MFRSRPRVTWLLRLAVAAALLTWVLAQADVRAGLASARYVHPWWLLAAFVSAGIATLVAAWRWHWCLRTCDCALPFGDVLRIAMAGNAAGLLSVGPLGVDAVRVALASRHRPDRKGQLVASVTLDHLTAIPALLLVGLVTVRALPLTTEWNDRMLRSLAAGLVVTVGIALIGRWCFPQQHRAFVRYASARLRAPGTAVAAVMSLPVTLAHYGIFWCAAQALAVPAPGVGLFGAIAIADSIAALPISVAGIGVREKSLEVLLRLWYGVAPALSVKASLTGLLIVAAWAVGGMLVFPTRHPRHKADGPVDIRALAARFPRGQLRSYAFGKFATDPLYEAVYHALNTHDVPLLDIGCGMGLCSFYLRARGYSAPILGIDTDVAKIAIAREVAAAHALDVTFAAADARATLPTHDGNVSILDVLQYLDAGGQITLLREAALRVAPGARLVIRTSLQAPGWRFALSRLGDWIAASTRWTYAPVCYPRAEVITSTMATMGLHGTMRPLWGRTPFNNWLGVFERVLR